MEPLTFSARKSGSGPRNLMASTSRMSISRYRLREVSASPSRMESMQSLVSPL